jgi:hypothetical protein
MPKTRKRSVTRGWAKQTPGKHERTTMLKRCGRMCFLGPNKTFPICQRKTCKIDMRGIHAAFSRARQWKHTAVARKAKKLLQTLKRSFRKL